MKLELSDEQRYVLELAVDDQIDALTERERKQRNYAERDGNETYSVDRMMRHRTILECLLIDLRFPE